MAKDKKKNIFKLPFSLNLSKYVDPFHLKILAAAFGFMTILSVSLIVASQLKERKEALIETQSRIAFQEGISKAFSVLGLSDFIFPEQYGRPEYQIYLQRTPHPQWSQEEVDRNWISIDDTGIDDLSGENHRKIRELLEGDH